MCLLLKARKKNFTCHTPYYPLAITAALASNAGATLLKAGIKAKKPRTEGNIDK